MPKTNTKKQPRKKTSTKKVVKTAVKKTSKTPVSGKVSRKTSGKKVTKKNSKKTSKKSSASNGERKYVLDSVLVINNAHTMHGQFMALINAKRNVVIDASSVEMVDTSILQLLLAFVIKLHAEDLKVTWMNPSNELLNRAEILDLSEKLGLAGQ